MTGVTEEEMQHATAGTDCKVIHGQQRPNITSLVIPGLTRNPSKKCALSMGLRLPESSSGQAQAAMTGTGTL